MAEKIKSALPPDLDLGGGWVVEWDAVDPATGATVPGVIISKTSLLVPGDYGGGGIEAATPYLLVPGPGDSGGGGGGGIQLSGEQVTSTPQPAPASGGTSPVPPTIDSATTSYRPYISASALNKTIPANAPVHPDTARMISSANHWLGTGTWLGPRKRPTYYRGDTSNQPHVSMYANNNGWVGAGPFTMPMPAWAAALIGPTSQTGDSNVVIVDSVTGDVWELWHTTPPGYTPRNTHDSAGSLVPDNRWNCSAYRHWPADTTTQKGYGPASKSYVPGTSASHIHIAAGLIVPEDAADCFSGSDPGTVIPHALRVGNFCGSDGTAHPSHVLPAYGGDGKQPQGIPAGAVIQLDPTRDYSMWPSVTALREPQRSWMRKLLRTMQVHGIYQVDSFPGPGGGNLDCAGPASVAKGGDGYPAGFRFPNEVAGYGWGLSNGVPEDLMSHFRVLDWTKYLPA